MQASEFAKRCRVVGLAIEIAASLADVQANRVWRWKSGLLDLSPAEVTRLKYVLRNIEAIDRTCPYRLDLSDGTSLRRAIADYEAGKFALQVEGGR